MLRAHSASVPTAPPTALGGDPLLDLVGPLAGARVLVIGHGAIETLCALLRRGCAAATEMRPGDCLMPEHDSADAVLVPRIASAAAAEDAIMRAARALTQGGHVALRDATSLLRGPIAALLRRHGFSGLRVRATGAGTLIGAERPIFGPLPRV